MWIVDRLSVVVAVVCSCGLVVVDVEGCSQCTEFLFVFHQMVLFSVIYSGSDVGS